MSLNSINYATANQQIGEVALTSLNRLLEEVYPDGELAANDSWRWALAPSIIIRGEMEMYGASHPRFGIRLHPFVESIKGFFNLRRIEETATQFAGVGWSPTTEELALLAKAELTYNGGRPPAETYQSSSCVADALLPVPGHLQRYELILSKQDLSLGYAETTTPHNSTARLPNFADPAGFAGSPYLHHIRFLGAGMCAEAACFMAAATHVTGKNRLHSLPEISMIGRGEANAPESGPLVAHEMGGLTNTQMVTYFDKAGTGPCAQVHEQDDTAKLIWKEYSATLGVSKEFVTLALPLRRYLLAGIPVILTVDFGRMHQSSTTDPGIPNLPATKIYNSAEPRSGNLRHAVLAVGVASTNPEQFIIHDPARRPFVELTMDTLSKIQPYLPDGINTELPGMIPVLPGLAKWMLANRVMDNKERAEYDSICGQVKAGQLTQTAADKKEAQISKKLSEFNLLELIDELKDRFVLTGPNNLRITRSTHVDLMHESTSLRFVDHTLLESEINKMFARAGIKQNVPESWATLIARDLTWAWVALIPDGDDWQLYMFDAQAESRACLLKAMAVIGAESINLYVCGPGTTEGLITEVPLLKPTAPAPDRMQNTALEGGLENRNKPDLALMTSCVASGGNIAEALKASEGIQGIDLYCFMREHLKSLLPVGVESNGSVLTTLSRFWDERIYDPVALAEKIHSECRGKAILALSSYLPEVASADDTLRGSASNSVAYLLCLGAELKRRNHPVKALELVCGTTIEKVLPVKNSQGAELFAAIERQRKSCIQRILACIRLGIQSAQNRNNSRPDLPDLTIPPIALEKEPGNFFILNSQDAIRELLKQIDSDALLKRHVGLNLDVPHWGLLCESGMGEFAQGADILKRIVHVHWSDHFSGHLSDLPIGFVRPWNDVQWRPWIGLVTSLVSPAQRTIRHNEGLPIFSGVVSLELEAARTKDDLARAVEGGKRLLG